MRCCNGIDVVLLIQAGDRTVSKPMTSLPLAPDALVYSASIMYALEKAGKNLEDLITFASANGHTFDSNFFGYWFSGKCVNEFLSA